MVSHRSIDLEAAAFPRILTSALSSYNLALKLGTYHRIGAAEPHPWEAVSEPPYSLPSRSTPVRSRRTANNETERSRT